MNVCQTGAEQRPALRAIDICKVEDPPAGPFSYTAKTTLPQMRVTSNDPGRAVPKREGRHRGYRIAGSSPDYGVTRASEGQVVPLKQQNGSFGPAFALRRQTLTDPQMTSPGRTG